VPPFYLDREYDAVTVRLVESHYVVARIACGALVGRWTCAGDPTPDGRDLFTYDEEG